MEGKSTTIQNNRLWEFFNRLKENKTDNWSPQDIIDFDSKLYKKIRRDKGLRDITGKINQDLIDAFWKAIHSESELTTKDSKLKEDYKRILKESISKWNKTITPSNICENFQWLYKRIVRNPLFIDQITGEIDRQKVHTQLWGDVSIKIGIKYQAHIIYSEEYLQQKLTDFFQKYITRSPKVLEKYDPKIYSHLVKNNININKSFRLSLQKKYGENNKLLYQYYDEESEKKAFQNFFEQHKLRYRSPTHLKIFSPHFYTRLRKVYTHWDKVDRIFILYKLVPEDKVKVFRHKDDENFKKYAKYSRKTDSLETIDYKLWSEDLNPEDLMVIHEEQELLQRVISKLSVKDQGIIAIFLENEKIAEGDLERIIIDLKEMVQKTIKYH